MFLIKAFRSANDVMTSSYAPKWSPLQMLFFQINLLSNLNIIRLVLGDWSCSGNIKQDFLTIFPICCFTKKAVNKWAYISETPPNQPDYPWFSKCTLNFGLGEHMLINSTDMWHLPPFSHWSITTFLVKEDHIWPFICYLKISICFCICQKKAISLKKNLNIYEKVSLVFWQLNPDWPQKQYLHYKVLWGVTL